MIPTRCRPRHRLRRSSSDGCSSGREAMKRSSRLPTPERARCWHSSRPIRPRGLTWCRSLSPADQAQHGRSIPRRRQRAALHLVDRQGPPLGDVDRRVYYFEQYWPEAVEATKARRLLLLVDGLDEQGELISSFLPAAIPDHVTFMVSSRPNPSHFDLSSDVIRSPRRSRTLRAIRDSTDSRAARVGPV